MNFSKFVFSLVLTVLLVFGICFAENESSDESNAIAQLHSRLDDDKDGVVNDQESCNFLHELVESPKDRRDKDNTFHRFDTDVDGNDFISVEELQAAWRRSKVRQWTAQDVINWLKSHDMKQYVPYFKAYQVNGKNLPALALHGGETLVQMGLSREDAEALADTITLAILFPVKSQYIKEFIISYFLPVVILLLLVLSFSYYRSENKASLLTRELQRLKKTLNEAEGKLKKQEDEPETIKQRPFEDSETLKDIIGQIKAIQRDMESQAKSKVENDLGVVKKQMDRIVNRKGFLGNFALAHAADLSSLNKRAAENSLEIQRLKDNQKNMTNLWAALENQIDLS